MGLINNCCCFLLVLLAFPSLLISAQLIDSEAALLKKLFQSYNPLVRPARKVEDVITVCFGLSLIQLISVDELDQIMKTNVWLRLRWSDYQLTWDPNEYNNISVIRMVPEKVWQPDIVLFNNADGKYEVSYKSRVLLYGASQTVVFIPPAIYQSTCKIDVRYFPFDQQECEMKFGSWTFNSDQIDLEFEEGFQFIDLSDYVISGTWDVMDCPGYIRKIIGMNGQTNRTRVDFKIVLRRKTLFHIVNLIIPCVLISFLSICVFYLPADAAEKITLSISILLALVVFLLLLQKILPPTSTTIPLIASYLLFTFILNIISIGSTVLVINWSFRTPRTHTMPRWMRVVFLQVLPVFLFMTPPNPDRNEFSNQFADPPGPVRPSNLIERHLFTEKKKRFALTREVYKACQSIRYIAGHLRKEDNYEDSLIDWKFLGLVLDRLLLVVFLAVTTSGTVGIFIKSPYIFEFVDQQKIIERLKSIKEESRKVQINSCFSG